MKKISLPKWCDILIGIYKSPEKKRYCQKISKIVKSHTNHTRAVVKALTDSHLVKIVPSKKIKKICLTEDGEKVASWCFNIKKQLND